MSVVPAPILLTWCSRFPVISSPRRPMRLLKRDSSAGMISAAQDRSPPASSSPARIVETDIPSRLDGLLWSGFHTRVVAALGITWILDGLEVTLAGALSG